jgi:hypothetical protein
MKPISVWGRFAAGFRTRRASQTPRRRATSFSSGTDYILEPRLVMSSATFNQTGNPPGWVLEPGAAGSTSPASPPAIQMLAATTIDSKSVTIEYRVNDALDAANPLQFGIYRSSNGQLGSSDSLVDTVTLANTAAARAAGAISVDQSGQPATALGTHELTIPLPSGLPPFPEKPYVLVVADPGSASAMTDPEQSASFRVYTIGIVTHGGIQDPSWRHGPPWVHEAAYVMKKDGLDSVITYNWALQSNTPGTAIKQSPHLAHIIRDVAAKFPASDPVDLEFIGHSEGTVVNTYAIVKLEREITPQLKAGYIEDFLLDPHAANNDVPGQQMSVAGPLSGLASLVITHYQGVAKDPPVFVPSAVDEAFVFFEHSQATASGIYNLWGQVPVRSDGPLVHYYNLTDMGVTHSGKTGVDWWFRDFIAPTLGYQAPLITGIELNGQIDNAEVPPQTPAATNNPLLQRLDNARDDRIYGPAQVVQSDEPEFSGTAAPGSIIRLALSPATKPMDLNLAGVTVASNTGQWSLTTGHPLRNGQYRTLVTAFSRKLTARPGLGIVPTLPLGRLVIDTTQQS